MKENIKKYKYPMCRYKIIVNNAQIEHSIARVSCTVCGLDWLAIKNDIINMDIGHCMEMHSMKLRAG
ncbi:MAG: hypothetical protein ACE5KT_11280 [Methanosarcinales archaeon]